MNLDFKGGMMVNDVTNITNAIWGVGVCLNICVQGFIQDFKFWKGRTPKFGVDVEWVYST